MQLRYNVLEMLLVASLVCGLLSCSLGAQEREISGSKGVYSFDARTVLQSITQGETNLFALQAATPEVTPVNLSPVRWRQQDYYRVAQAFHEFIWHESVESWKLHTLFFRSDCEYAPFGPQFADFTLFKMAKTHGDDSRLERDIYVEPRRNQASWIEIERYPLLSNWEALDPTQIRIPAEEALQIAEAQGGRETRLGVEDKCRIYVTIGAGSRDNNWTVTYSGNDNGTLFSIQIDERTGEYEIVYPKAK